jgi:hypothetical protein
MRKLLPILVGALIFVFLMIAGREEPLFPRNTSDVPTAPALGSVKVDQDFGQMPLYFIPNKEQVAAQVDYYVQGIDKTIYFTSEGLTYVLNGRGAGDRKAGPWDFRSRPLPVEKAENELQDTRRWVVKLNFVGSNSDVHPWAEEKTEAVISYFKGRPEKWKTGLPTYSRIVYRDLWPGIDLVYYGTMDRLKYEFIVHPGAEPSHIRLAYSGVSGLEVNDEGRLEVSTPVGVLEDDVPNGYQEVDGKKVDVALKYWLEELMVEESRALQEDAFKKSYIYGFEVGEYDRTRPLVLDPAVLIYCGYIGGSGDDCPSGIAVDDSGNAYVTGRTESTEATFPVTIGPFLTYNGGSKDGFVAKVNSMGTALLYCGYIGGSGDDYSYGIAVDGSGNAYVTGRTNSNEATFPVTVGPDLTFNGDWDAFVAKVNSAGTALVYCGYIGGLAYDDGLGIAIDGSGNAYITGQTDSNEASFPVTVGPDLTYNGGGYGDAFVVKVDSTGTALLYCGYIGGSDDDYGSGIAVDSSGNAYVTGPTSSNEATFPVTFGPDLTHNGGFWDAFVAKVNSVGTALLYCGYIGGSGADWGSGGIAVDSSGNAYVIGNTKSTQATFPVTVGPDLTYNGGEFDAFVAKVNSVGTALLYCGYIGGFGDDYGCGIAVGSSGNAYVVGHTNSAQATFPVTIGPDLTYNGGSWDAFVAKVNSAGTALLYCGYIGGSGADWGSGGIAVDSSGDAYVMGSTNSTQTTFPVTVGPDLTFNSANGDDVFVAKIPAEPREAEEKEAEQKETEKKKGCFIATAAYGSSLHPHVKILRDFRDKYLMTSKAGRKLVSLYYRYSPVAADTISKCKILRIFARIYILPVIGFSYLMVHFGTVVIALLLVFFSLFSLFFIKIRMRIIN